MKFALTMSLLLVSTTLFAQDVPTAPTKPSKPLPTLSETQNIDTVMTEKAQAAIRKNPTLKDQAVSAASRDGVITLQGSVENKDQEQSAIDSVKGIAGVSQVKSELTIKKVD